MHYESNVDVHNGSASCVSSAVQCRHWWESVEGTFMIQNIYRSLQRFFALDSTSKLVRSPAFRGDSRSVALKKAMNNRVSIHFRPNYLYARIPKAANSTVTFVLADCLRRSGRLSDEESDVSPKKLYRAYRLSEMSRREIAQIGSTHFKFAFVRNPYRRALSAYLDKIARPFPRIQELRDQPYEHARRLMVTEALNCDFYEPVSFEQFVGYLERGGINDDPHWCRQIDLIPHHLFELDFIGKVETLQRDLLTVVEQLFGMDYDNISQVRRGPKTAADNVIGEYYSKELQDRVFGLYARDFAVFGYDSEHS